MDNILNKKLARMQFGFEKINEIKEESISQNFKSHIKNIPMYINSNGLIPTLAFIMAKTKKENDEAKSYKFISKMMMEYFIDFELVKMSPMSLEKLIEEMFAKDMTDYRKCTLEVLSMLKWAVKFAEGMIKKEK